MEDQDYSATETEQIEVEGEDDNPQEEMLRAVLQDFESAEQARAEHEPHWDRYFKKYMCHLDKHKWRSKIFDPETFAAIETILPRIANTIFGAPEVFGLKPTGMEDVEKARVSEYLLNYQADRMNLYPVCFEIIKDALIYGTGHGKLYWRKDYEPRYREEKIPVVGQDPNTGQPTVSLKSKWKKSFMLVYDNPWLDRVDIKDLYVDPLATTPHNARFVVHRFYRSRDYLKKKQLEGVYSNVDNIEASNATGSDHDERKDSIRIVDRSNVVVHSEMLEDVELLEYWGQYDIDEDGYQEEVVITVANRTTILRADYNQFPGGVKPFVKFCPIPIPGSYYGLSPIHPMEGLQDGLNDRMNQIGDNISLILNNMWIINPYADIDEDDLVSAPGGVIRAQNPAADILPLPSKDIVPSVSPEIARFEMKIQKALGTYDVSRGQMPERQETATTTIALQNVAEIRFKTMTLLFERDFIRPLGNMMLRLNKAFMSKIRQIRILGNEFMVDPAESRFLQLGPEDVVENPDIYAVGAALEVGASKEMQLTNIMKFLQITSQPIFQSNPLWSIDYGVLLERLPYLLNIKLKRPLIVNNNPMLAYQEVSQDKSLADQMMMGEMNAGLPAGTNAAIDAGGGNPMEGGEMPSRVKGEMAKSEVNQGGESEQ